MVVNISYQAVITTITDKQDKYRQIYISRAHCRIVGRKAVWEISNLVDSTNQLY